MELIKISLTFSYIENLGKSMFVASKEMLNIVSKTYSSSMIVSNMWYKFEMLSSLDFTLTSSLGLAL